LSVFNDIGVLEPSSDFGIRVKKLRVASALRMLDYAKIRITAPTSAMPNVVGLSTCIVA
jgi:hypothetical protein